MEEQPQRKTLRDKINNIEYIKGKLLGTGGFAKCFEVINQNDQKIYAAKVIPKKSINEKRQRYKLLVEIKIHRSLKHKHIVQFLEAFQDRENVYILLEYCRNYTLKDLVKRRKRLTEYEAKVYTLQIVKAVQYIHTQSIIHRDLKLGNILINDAMDTKICDFGLSTRVKNEGQIKKTICGTPNYIAPEILQENGHSYQVDIWSIGVVLYTLLFGKPPFQDNTVEQTYENIKHNRFRYPDSINVSGSAKDLINRILVTDPSRRIGLNDIMNHEFMSFRDDIPRMLPRSTLAVPPFKFAKIQSKRISLYDVNLEMSEELESYLEEGDTKNLSKSDQYQQGLLRSKEMQRQKIKPKEVHIPYNYIKQCFFMGETLGFLFSSGIVGIFYKNSKTNVMLQFGQANYFIIPKQQQKIIKKPLPSNDFELHSLFVQEPSSHLQELLNFKSYFITKYGIFGLEEFHKKLAMSKSMLLNSSNKMKNKNHYSQNQQEDHTYVKKVLKLNNGQILIRLSNGIVQLCFNDLSSLFINREDDKGLFFVNSKGKVTQINYKQCHNTKLKTKVRRFSNLMRKISQQKNIKEQDYESSNENNSKDNEDEQQSDNQSY